MWKVNKGIPLLILIRNFLQHLYLFSEFLEINYFKIREIPY